MILLALEEVSKQFGPEPVLSRVSLEIRPGEKIGLVGPNGAGKSTLLKILAGLETPERGQVIRHPSAGVAYLEQHPDFASGQTVWQAAAEGLASLRALAVEVEQSAQAVGDATDPATRNRLAERYDRLQHEAQRRGAYQFDHHVDRILSGLGFAEDDFTLAASVLSGGQQNRLLLARLLLGGADVLLLDEPSNHLDIQSTEWLEDFLAQTRQAIVIVSHDRYLLDRVTNRTLELFEGSVDEYSGGFSAYWRQKAERLAVQQRTYEKQQETIVRTEEFIRRNLAGQKTAQAKDRIKKLERMERVAPPREIAAPAMGFAAASRCGDVVLRVEKLSKGFGQPLFSQVSFEINRGQRWGILGPNGSGKTTLLRCLVGELSPDAGRVVVGAGVVKGYFDQLLTGLDLEAEAVDAIRPEGKQFDEPKRRDLLARFGLKGDQVFQKISSLSGGERNRTALARLSAMEANFLILDEPTNHLDLWARDSLERSLLEYEGTVLLASHDRYFLNRVVDRLLVLEEGRARIVYGNYDVYLAQKRQGSAPAREESKGVQSSRGGLVAKRPPRRRRFPYRKLSDIEAEIGEREARLAELQQLFADPDLHRDGGRVREVKREIAEQQESLAALYEHWEEAAELN